jgi:hypothetical protein
MSITCPSCKTTHPDGTAVCTACGYVFSEDTAKLEAPPAGGGEGAPGALVPKAIRSLLVIAGHDIGKEFSLEEGTYVIGRDPGADIFLNDITVTRRHATLTVTPFRVDITDLGSLNGTYVNGTPIESAQLRDGDEIQIGKFKLMFSDRRGE